MYKGIRKYLVFRNLGMPYSMVQKTSLLTLQQLLQEWDNGKSKTRQKILKNFIAGHKNNSGTDLEEEFGGAGSLFLVRITTWLRLTYLLGQNIKIQLDAIKIFLSASCGQRYLTEFMEVGGVLTVLEILGLKVADEQDKAAALELLESVAECGRKYKELICESYGVRAAAECMARASTAFTQECARSMLYTLARGNPRYQKQVYQVLKDLLPSTNPGAQRVAAQGLRHILELVGCPPSNDNLIENILSNLLRSLYNDVQYEAGELIESLMKFEPLQEGIISGLVALLVPAGDDAVIKVTIQSDAPLPQHIQQASSAKLLGLLCMDNPTIAKLAVDNMVVKGLINVLRNVRYPLAQKHAARTLYYLVNHFTEVQSTLSECLGSELYAEFLKSPETLNKKLTPVQLDKLMGSKYLVETTTTITEAEEEEEGEEEEKDEQFNDDVTVHQYDGSDDEDENGVQTENTGFGGVVPMDDATERTADAADTSGDAITGP